MHQQYAGQIESLEGEVARLLGEGGDDGRMELERQIESLNSECHELHCLLHQKEEMLWKYQCNEEEQVEGEDNQLDSERVLEELRPEEVSRENEEFDEMVLEVRSRVEVKVDRGEEGGEGEEAV